MNKKTTKKSKVRKIVGNASPNQRYYILQDEEGLPVSYDSVSPQSDQQKKKTKHLTIPVKTDYTSSLFPRSPSFSPISRLKFGQLLEQKIQSSLKEKIASGANTDVISVGNVGVSTLQKLTEEELLKKFGTKNITSNFEKPYDDIDNTTFHDSVRSDGMTRNVMIKKAQYTVGEFTDIEFTPNFEISQEEERNQTQDDLNSNELLNSLKRELKKIDEDVDFFLALHGLLLHQGVFGQGLVAIEHDEQNIPIALKILSGMRIGRLFKDSKSWKIRGIEYLDYSSANQKNILLAEDLIYIPNLDFNLAPNTAGYGLSDLETIRHIAEQNVILNQMDIKEGNAKYHTPRVFISIKNAESPQDIIDITSALEKSQSVVTDLDGEPKVIDNTTDMTQLTEERDMNDAAIARYGDVPSILAGFENAQIRAAASQVLFAWTQSSLMKARETLRVYIQKQWYMRNLVLIIKRRLKRLGLLETQTDPRTGKPVDVPTREALNQQSTQSQTQTQTPPNQAENPNQNPTLETPEQTRLSENGLQLDANGDEVIPKISSFTSIRAFIPFLDHPEKLPITIKMTFEPITIDGMLEKAATVVSLKNARIINNMYAWKILKFKDLIANPPPELNDLGISGTEDMNAWMTNQRENASLQAKTRGTMPKGGVGDLGNLDIESLVTGRGKKPKPKLNVNRE